MMYCTYQDGCKEASVWSRLDHVNILPLQGLTFEHSTQSLSLVSPWMETGDLTSYLRYHSPIYRLSLVCIVEIIYYLRCQRTLVGRGICHVPVESQIQLRLPRHLVVDIIFRP